MTPDEGGRKKPCTTAMQLMCFSKTWDCSAFVDLLDKEMAMPGEDASMDLRLVKPMVLEEGQQFTIRDSSGTIGTGRHQSNTCLTGSVSCNRSSSLFRFNIHVTFESSCYILLQVHVTVTCSKFLLYVLVSVTSSGIWYMLRIMIKIQVSFVS